MNSIDRLVNDVKIMLKNDVMDGLTRSNITECRETINKTLDFLQQAGDFQDFLTERNLNLSSHAEQIIAERIEQIDAKSEPKMETKPQHHSIAPGWEGPLTFKRFVKAGSLVPKGIFVPEKIIRDFKLKEGDQLIYMEIGEENGKKQYEYKLFKRGDGFEAQNRVQIDWLPVIFDDDLKRHCVDFTPFGEEIEMRMPISESDLIDFKLSDRSFVSIAYLKGKADDFKVIWREKDEAPVDSQKEDIRTPQKASFYKKNNTKNDEVFEEADAFKGYTILVVGNQPDHHIYREAIEKRGGVFLGADGDEGQHETYLKSLVKKADIVVNFLRQMRHSASWNVYDAVEDIDLTENIQNGGKSKLLRIIKEKIALIEEKEEKFVG